MVYEHPGVDVDGAWLDRKTYTLRTAWSSPGTYHVRYFDDTVRKVMEGFRGDRLANVWITGVSREASTTSAMKFASDTSLMTSAPAAAPPPWPSSSMS